STHCGARSEPTSSSRLFIAGARFHKTREIAVNLWRSLDPTQISGRIKARENCVHDLRPRHTSLPVPKGNIARPKAHIIEAELLFRPEVNHGMAMFAATHLGRPKDLHEIARLSLREIIKVAANIQLVEKAGGAGTVGVPAAPNSLAIALIADHELIEGFII